MVGGVFVVHPSVTPGALPLGYLAASGPLQHVGLIPASAGKHCGLDTSQHPAHLNTRGSSQLAPGYRRPYTRSRYCCMILRIPASDRPVISARLAAWTPACAAARIASSRSARVCSARAAAE